MLPCSLIVRAHPRLPLASPPSAGQSRRSFPYIVTSLLPYLTIACPDLVLPLIPVLLFAGHFSLVIEAPVQCWSGDPDRVGTAHYCFKSFSCNTYGLPCKCCKQKTYGLAKPFRCSTYRKHGGRGWLLLTRDPKKDFYPEGAPRPRDLSSPPDEGCLSRASTCPERGRGIGGRDLSSTSHESRVTCPTGCRPLFRMLRFGVP